MTIEERAKQCTEELLQSFSARETHRCILRHLQAVQEETARECRDFPVRHTNAPRIAAIIRNRFTVSDGKEKS